MRSYLLNALAHPYWAWRGYKEMPHQHPSLWPPGRGRGRAYTFGRYAFERWFR